MAREIVVFGRCDRCSHRAPEDELAMDVELWVAGEGGLVDLCQDCAAALAEATAGFVSVAHPPPPKKKRRQPVVSPPPGGRAPRRVRETSDEERTCREPGCDGFVAKSPGGLGLHRFRKHGVRPETAA